MKMKLAQCLVTSHLTFGADASAAPDPNFDIYLCFGQSNMESGGNMDEADQVVDNAFRSWRILFPPIAAGRKANGITPSRPWAARGCGICMVDYFGRTMVAGLPENIRVGVVKVAVPGCKIELFEKLTCTNYAATVQP